jgi:hypothetical protein
MVTEAEKEIWASIKPQSIEQISAWRSSPTVEKKIWASIEPQSIEPTLAWRYQARSSPAAEFKSTSGWIILQVPRHLLIPKGECQIRELEERRRGQWIATFKQKEGGTNSEHEQLMRREIPLAFA